MASSHRGKGKAGCCNSLVQVFGISGLILLGIYGIFLVWVEHRRSVSAIGQQYPADFFSEVASRAQEHSLRKSQDDNKEGADCKLVQVISTRRVGAKPAGVDFQIGGESVLFTLEKGLQTIVIDPRTQVVDKMPSYQPWDVTDAARLAQDVAALPPGHVVLVSMQADKNAPAGEAVQALRRLGATANEFTSDEVFVLITVMDGQALAESQGARAVAQGRLPCRSERDIGSLTVPVVLPAAPAQHGQSVPPAPAPVVLPAAPAQHGQSVPPAPAPRSWWASPWDTGELSKKETSWRCVGNIENRSCHFRNMYYTSSGFTMFLVGKKPNDLRVKRANKYEGPWTPRVDRFASESNIERHLEKSTVIEEKGLSLYFHPIFHHNIGHGLFDGLYPAFLALVKLGLHEHPFRPVVAVTNDCFDEFSQGALKVGDIVETYLKSDKPGGRSLRTSHAKIIEVAEDDRSSARCTSKINMDHGGLDLGAQGAPTKESCCSICAQTFGCVAGVLFANLCYLKGKCSHGGSNCYYPKEERILSLLPEGRKMPDVTVQPLSKEGEMLQAETRVPYDWVIGKVRRRCKTEDIYKTFGQMGEIRKLFEIERDARAHRDLILHFEELVVGVGGAGNLIADTSGAIGGSLPPLNAMALFRDRMLAAYDLPVPGKGENTLGKERGVITEKDQIYAIVIANKRFIGQDVPQIDKALMEVGKGRIRAEYIDWGFIGGPTRSFKEHLRKVQEADVYVSSIGTALQYVPFMRDGAIYVALGSVWMRSGQYFPTFMESQLAGAGTPYLRTLYADPGAVIRKSLPHPILGEDGYFASVNATLLVELLYRAESMLRTGFRIPVPAYENLGVEGRILLELCARDPQTCQQMNNLRNNQYECAVLLWPECIVYEVGPWRDRCGVNRPLLRELRRKHGIPGYGAPED